MLKDISLYNINSLLCLIIKIGFFSRSYGRQYVTFGVIIPIHNFFLIWIKIQLFCYRYHIAKLIELNEIKTVRAEDTRPSDDAGLKIVKYNGKEYHAVLFDSGGK